MKCHLIKIYVDYLKFYFVLHHPLTLLTLINCKVYARYLKISQVLQLFSDLNISNFMVYGRSSSPVRKLCTGLCFQQHSTRIGQYRSYSSYHCLLFRFDRIILPSLPNFHSLFALYLEPSHHHFVSKVYLPY